MNASKYSLSYLQLNTLDLNLYHTQEFPRELAKTVVAGSYSLSF